MSQMNPGAQDYPPNFPPVAPPPAPTTRQSTAGWLAPLALVISLLAAAGAGWSLFKPHTPATPSIFAANPTAENPKDAACKAFVLVAKGASLQSQRDLGREPVALETVAANTRLALASGAIYLRDKVPSNTPPELAEPLAKLSGQFQEIAQHFFAGQTSSDAEQGARLKAADETSKKLLELCG